MAGWAGALASVVVLLDMVVDDGDRPGWGGVLVFRAGLVSVVHN